jgi:hypothetical protein
LQELQDSIGGEIPVFQGKIAIMFDEYFLKAQGVLRSEWPKLRIINEIRQFSSGGKKETTGVGECQIQ